MRTKSLVITVVLVGMTIAGIGVAGRVRSTAPASPSKQTLDLSHEIMSPFCPGLTLAACPSPAALELRNEVRDRFAAGESRESITQDLLGRYGLEIQGTPPASGLGLVVWLLPLFVAGTLVVAVRTVLARGAVAAPAVGATEADPTDHARWRDRLDEELEQLG
jgi:cytochrome c-type biogenesis protein CcmH